jgi:DNA-damage-inducible protein J
MAQVLVNFRMDEDLKKSMESVCNELGMNMTTAFTIFAKKLSREKRIPFEVSVDPFYSETNLTAIKESISQLSNGKVVTKSLEELEEMENE